jgi:uncharacterized protein YprB with RNaseH-like and TPR domain
VDLKQKLAHLNQEPRVANPKAPESPSEPGVPFSDGKADRESMLARLREQMTAVMQRQHVPVSVSQPSPPPLDFAPFETARGFVHRRTRRWSVEHWIGCVPVAAALGARADFWALLALDPKLRDVEPKRALFLDTETTGLGGGAGILAFLIGLAWFDADHTLVLEQLLLRSPADEAALLELLTERVSTSSLLVTFNGKSFDWPLLASRFVMNRLVAPSVACHLDLLHVARRLHKPRMTRVNLRALEAETLSIERGPDIDGAEIGPRYNHFLRTGDEDAIRPVIEHNSIDVLSMVALAGLYGEPLERVDEADWVPLGRVLRRARDFERAQAMAERALKKGGSLEARRLRAELAKARGDRDSALLDFETLCQSLDDPKLRLELAKLYEHHAKSPQQALEMLDRGTGESADAAERRRMRLQRKLQT